MKYYSRSWRIVMRLLEIYTLMSIIAFIPTTSSLEHARSRGSNEAITSQNIGINEASGCHISFKEFLASAETAAKVILQGVYNPREIEDRLHNIESQMADQLNVIKTMILNIEDKLAQQDVQYRRANRKLHGAVAELSESVQSCSNLQQPGDASKATDENLSSNKLKSPLNSNSRNSKKNDPHDGIKSTGSDPSDEEDVINARQEEVERFNSSIHLENGKRVFSYYWKVSDMEYKLNSWGPRRSLRSPSFYIFEYGYMMYIRMFPRHNGQNVYAHVGLTKGGYDEALEWPFLLKHRISILDQAPPPYQDIVSRIWDPKVLCSAWNWKRPSNGDNHECVGLGFPSEDLRAHNFIHEDSIVIKLTVYLD